MTANFSCSKKVKEHQNTKNKLSLLQSRSKLSKLQLGKCERAAGDEGKLDHNELQRETSREGKTPTALALLSRARLSSLTPDRNRG
jgi:hypothetical protein